MKTIIYIANNSFYDFTINPQIKIKSDIKLVKGDELKIKLDIFKKVKSANNIQYHYEPFNCVYDYFKVSVTDVELLVNKDNCLIQIVYVKVLDDSIDKITKLIKSDNDFLKQDLDLD